MGRMRKKLYIKLKLELISPICISNGINQNTNVDVIRNYNGEPFIPGSSMAGAMSDFLKSKEDIREMIFGYSKIQNSKTQTKISNLIIYDSFFQKEVKIDTRDGVGLNERKIAEDTEKFSWEIIPPGNTFDLKVELNISEGMKEKEKDIILGLKSIFTGIDKGVVRFGYKKNRGFGKCKIISVYWKEYVKDNEAKCRNILEINNLDNWMKFQWEDMKKIEKSEWYLEDFTPIYDKTLSIPLKLKGGISIRRYASSLDKPDFQHVTNIVAGERNAEIPIIPGTSWAGAIRHRCRDILIELGVLNQSIIKEMLDCIFGFVEKDCSAGSLITVEESNLINKSGPLIIRRTKIDPFTSSAFSKGLFEEASYFKGSTVLEINMKHTKYCKQRCQCEHICDGMWIMGLLVLVKEDIENGYLPIGGQTAIGRGIFEKDKGSENKINEISETEKKEYLKSLFNYIVQKEEERGKHVCGN